MPGHALTPAVAWLAKLPARGDFVAGGPPTVFVEGWRDWALAGVAALRARGDGAAFAAAPLWRFSAGPGVFAAQGGVGVAAPGADSVGRVFPALAVAAGAGGAAGLEGPWLDAAEAALRAALGPGGAPETLAAALRAAPAASAPLTAAGAAPLFAAVAADGRRIAREGPADAALFRALFGGGARGADPEPGP